MANDEHLAILLRGVTAWNEWRDSSKEIPNLCGADLESANLIEANLSKADLSNANLSKAKLSGANLTDADLIYSSLSGANLSEAKLKRAKLLGADLSYARLRALTVTRRCYTKPTCLGPTYRTLACTMCGRDGRAYLHARLAREEAEGIDPAVVEAERQAVRATITQRDVARLRAKGVLPQV